MRIKQTAAKKITGIPNAQATVAMGDREAVIQMSTIDVHGIISGFASLRLHPQEARRIADALKACAQAIEDEDMKAERAALAAKVAP